MTLLVSRGKLNCEIIIKWKMGYFSFNYIALHNGLFLLIFQLKVSVKVKKEVSELQIFIHIHNYLDFQ